MEPEVAAARQDLGRCGGILGFAGLVLAGFAATFTWLTTDSGMRAVSAAAFLTACFVAIVASGACLVAMVRTVDGVRVAPIRAKTARVVGVLGNMLPGLVAGVVLGALLLSWASVRTVVAACATGAVACQLSFALAWCRNRLSRP
jgi:hypothetical protein